MEFRFITRFPVFKIWTLDFKENKISKWISDEVIWDVENFIFMILKTLLTKKTILTVYLTKGQTLYTTIYNTYIIYNNIHTLYDT